ncbi:pseudaminic acid cytidylyltransferase [Tenacibaculum sp. M341]|uniref:pseudaminic acid cytidylyltransferase n=1 Tax=Tenacibaculum sp. M341 TaxID=2530339 RepID=UPI001048875A|nr:pseudaminic acid cytidylyltransferase [Tenacibaculum sp. M341]TCI91733.1 pseudaminic acid cytidylyltransferase [Tenacibaculum sp. M341]
MSNLAIIPARGGSKRIPKKNIKLFLGKPIIAYSIEAAINSGLFDEVMVSTDNSEIAEIAKLYGATVPFMRSDENSDDFATTIDVIEEVLSEYSNLDKEFNNTCCIYPTAPFIDDQKLVKAYKHLIDNDFDCVFPVLKYGFPIQRSLRKDEKNGEVLMFYPENLNARSQDLEPAFHDSGQFYFFNTKVILKEKRLWTNNTGAIEISELEGQDIDNEVDWKLAEIKYKIINEKKNSF